MHGLLKIKPRILHWLRAGISGHPKFQFQSMGVSGHPKFQFQSMGIQRLKGFRLLIFLLGLIFCLRSAQAQTYNQVDSATYKHYQEKDWVELVKIGKSALKQDFDFYYLRMRIGIAYYEMKNFKSAQIHFKKALIFSENDPLALEYLYFAYLLGGQSQQAALLYKSFSTSLQDKIKAPDLNLIDRTSAEYLYNHTFTDDLVNNPATFEGLPYGVRIITRNYHNLNIGLNHNMHPGTSFKHSYTYLGKSNYYYYDDGIDRFGTDGQQVTQHQYYLSPSFTTAGGLVISPAFHFLYVGYQVYSVSGSGGGGDDIVFNDESVNQLLGGLTLQKYQGAFNFSIGGVYSNLNETNQFTGSGSLTWYPTGNLDMYLGTSLFAHIPDLKSSSLELIPNLIFGYGIASKVWIEISGTYGEMRNFAESNGYIVYNGLDWMKYKAIGNIIVPLGKKGSMIYAGTRFAQYENKYISFTTSQPKNQYLISYNSISIFGGISWKF